MVWASVSAGPGTTGRVDAMCDVTASRSRAAWNCWAENMMEMKRTHEIIRPAIVGWLRFSRIVLFLLEFTEVYLTLSHLANEICEVDGSTTNLVDGLGRRPRQSERCSLI